MTLWWVSRCVGHCYDYLGHVLFTWHLPELWRRFTIALRRRRLDTLRAVGVKPGCGAGQLRQSR